MWCTGIAGSAHAPATREPAGVWCPAGRSRKHPAPPGQDAVSSSASLVPQEAIPASYPDPVHDCSRPAYADRRWRWRGIGLRLRDHAGTVRTWSDCGDRRQVAIQARYRRRLICRCAASGRLQSLVCPDDMTASSEPGRRWLRHTLNAGGPDGAFLANTPSEEWAYAFVYVSDGCVVPTRFGLSRCQGVPSIGRSQRSRPM